MTRYTLLSIVILLLLGSCASKKKQAAILEASKPEWLRQRPVHPSYFFGIGVTSKVGAPLLYEDKAKERALADLASQISSQVSTESTLRKFEDQTGVHEYLSSRIKATSAEFLEGYEYLDKWEDENHYYAYFRLSKQEFYHRKAQRKEEALNNALNKYTNGLDLERNQKITEAMGLYATAMDILSGYLDETCIIHFEEQNIDLVETCRLRLSELIQSLSISTTSPQIYAATNERINEGTIPFVVKGTNQTPMSNIPVKFQFSGGYLRNEKAKSDDEGFVASPLLEMSTTDETLMAQIDLVQLGRQLTRNLFVRQIINNEHSPKAEATIVIKE
jgi:hypothetical protein